MFYSTFTNTIQFSVNQSSIYIGLRRELILKAIVIRAGNLIFIILYLQILFCCKVHNCSVNFNSIITTYHFKQLRKYNLLIRKEITTLLDNLIVTAMTSFRVTATTTSELVAEISCCKN